MSTAALSALPSSLASLLSTYSNKAQAGTHDPAPQTHSDATATAGAALGSDPAYTLSLGQQASSSALVGYTKLAKLGGQFEGSMAQLETPSGTASSSLGSITVDVLQLAKPQTLLSSAFGDSDHVSLGTGTLTLQSGSVGADGQFSGTGDATQIDIKTGTLDDLVASINGAQTGVQASVVEEGGGFALQLSGTGEGADHAFRLQGLTELNFDPSQPNSSMLTESQKAQNSVYSVDGGDYEYSGNAKVPVGFGQTADFAALGNMTVARQPQAEGVQSLVTAFNSIQHSIVQMAGKDGELAKDANLAAAMFKSLSDTANGTFDTGGKFTSLSQIGITAQADGTLAVDQTALSEAVANSPNDLQALISAVSTAMDKAMSPYLGTHGSLASQADILAKQITKGSSLLDYLSGSTTGATNSKPSLLDALNGSSSSSTGSSGAPKTLLDYLNASDSGTSTSSEFGQNGNATTGLSGASA